MRTVDQSTQNSSAVTESATQVTAVEYNTSSTQSDATVRLQTVATADRAVKIHFPDSTSSLLLFVSMSDTDRLLTGPGSALSVQSMVAEICSQGTVTDGCELQDRATHTVRA